MLDLSTARVNEDDVGNDNDDGAPLRFPLKNTSQVNRELSIKKPAKNKTKEGDEPSSKKGEAVEQKKGSLEAYGEQQATDSRKPKLMKEVLPEKDDVKCVGAARTPEKSEERQPENLPLAYYSPYVIWLTKLGSELSQYELLTSEYVFGKVEDVDDTILNYLERKRDLTIPSRLFMSCDQSVSSSQSTCSSIITAL
ncbi:hypothetical protein Cgig2_014527 [Carnegiea gigantea]|uniref:Uncharacterized protein n=1 Tax=Carnegiea gigantea TaxID=171969 RepID=A0A9Q1GJJ4_9CARY|nr:hypothetical protein Cgig2_014527 [Carnegiea gigantea]